MVRIPETETKQFLFFHGKEINSTPTMSTAAPSHTVRPGYSPPRAVRDALEAWGARSREARAHQNAAWAFLSGNAVFDEGACLVPGSVWEGAGPLSCVRLLCGTGDRPPAPRTRSLAMRGRGLKERTCCSHALADAGGCCAGHGWWRLGW